MHKEGAVGILFFAMPCLVEGQVIWEARAQGEYGVPPGPLGGDTHLERAEHERDVPVAHASTQSARGWKWAVDDGLVNDGGGNGWHCYDNCHRDSMDMDF